MTKLQKKAREVIALLNEHYAIFDKCYLDYNEEKPWQLLIATILSAQSTDKCVNEVTKGLFDKYKSLEDFAGANVKELEKDVFKTGFYHTKAKNIIATSQILIEKYGGNLPCDIDELVKLPGVGRKTANVIRGHIYKIPSIVVDTHVKRISKKLGLTKLDDPDKIEFDLVKILPEESFISYNTHVIAHGREVCTAKKPNCAECFLSGHCDWFTKGKE